MATQQTVMLDGNEAVARIAHLLNEVIAIYPITPASPMGEHADDWSATGQTNLWGAVPDVIEMQSEAGAAGAIHGALQAGSLATTFTASQGLLLMLPNMFKIAGELSPTVIHVAARTVATHALSIFGDHSDVMAARSTGFGMLCSNSVQEALDFAFIAQEASHRGRIPMLHFFDGFRTSHEVAKVQLPDRDMIRSLMQHDAVEAHLARGLAPEHPVLRGSSQNPDVFFQAREAVNPLYAGFPGIVQQVMDAYAEATGRQYRLFEYSGAADAERVIVMMGSGADTARETVDALTANGEKVGVLAVRLFRPLDGAALAAALPDTVQAVAVLDRTKEPGADGEPLYKDVVTALAESRPGAMPRVCGGRYGLSSKEFTPGMVAAVFEALASEAPPRQFTVGIRDDVSHLSLDWDESFRSGAHNDSVQALFYGLGSDGTVSANKNTIRIIGEQTDLYAQGYFVYDSKKSGAVTISHLRFGPRPIRSAYLVEDGDANFIACHQPVFLERFDMLEKAAPGATFLLNTEVPADQVWDSLPRNYQQHILDKKIRVYAIDAYQVAHQTGLGKRINTIMQTCFFAIAGVLEREAAIQAIKDAVEKSYGRKSQRIAAMNRDAIDATLAQLHDVTVDGDLGDNAPSGTVMPASAPDFVQRVTAEIIAGRGDAIPVSEMPLDGTWPLGTAAYEKRNLALEIPVWETDLCTHCGKCVFVCPHSAIRSKAFDAAELNGAPETFKSIQIKGKDFPEGVHISYQVAPEDCTGCTLCVDICPIRDKSNASRKAINMAPQPPLREAEAANWEFFESLPEYDHAALKLNTMKGSMLLEPHFEFSGACVGCGETPYVRAVSQLFGDRMIVANATGCSSIYGGNLPTTPWRTNAEGRGPAWNNSLFEDNAEFGLGIRVALDVQRKRAREMLAGMGAELPSGLAEAILACEETNEAEIHEQRERVARLKLALGDGDSGDARALLSLADSLCHRSVWIIGGDGWAYDIGFGGLDHVLASGRNVNLLVLDTEVYSNTGGQTSKATPRGAVAKFSAAGKVTGKKDLARIAMDYENVYVAHVAYGAKDTQTLNALLEAESYPGTSLIIAYSPCIAHGVDMSNNHRQQNLAVDSGHWPLFRFDPRREHNPLKLDSKPPSIPYRQFVESETRFGMLWYAQPDRAEALLSQAEVEVRERYHRYQQLAGLDWSADNGDKED
ncbi:MAG: pyruvate:ferredoxin (flavodoxin) oxidoreductase [Halieaceae bacterium]|jgi:pyruvate-ferredoxin/flavodoxin oxidoreductase|nr:pyruvate:ferredoxin (flavodoxin) oxidoreductase [Halieaceae bacterium]